MINFDSYIAQFPQQRVGDAVKRKPAWYCNCIDYVIHAGLNFNDRAQTELQLNILQGNIPDEFYKKTLNPYNAANERYTRFPATMRNLDIMNDIVRRYVSEYYKSVHDFTVTATSPELVAKHKAKLQQEIGKLAMQAFQQEIEKIYNNYNNKQYNKDKTLIKLILNKQYQMLKNLLKNSMKIMSIKKPNKHKMF